jgi:predicted Zn-dependent protease
MFPHCNRWIVSVPKKALVLLQNMAKIFPDSIDVKIHLSDAYSKVGRSEEARRLIEPIVNSQPFNLLARKIAKIEQGK